MMRSFILTRNLGNNPYSGIIGYPHAKPYQIKRRIAEVEGLGIRSVSFTGPTSVGKLNILGKGYVGVVVLAKCGTRRVALKIRRTDSQRSSMRLEAKMLKLANSAKVGPKFYDASRNCLVMEYVNGQRISSWVRSVSGRGSVSRVKSVIRGVLEDCYRLDQAGIDHGELSNISKHVIVGEAGHALIDFESSSVQRRTSNVTSATQAIFIGSGISSRIQRIYKIPAKMEIIEALRLYKRHGSRQNFDGLLGVLKLT